MEDYLHLATEGLGFGSGKMIESATFVFYGAGAMFDQLQDGSSQCAFATTAFAHETESFATIDVERKTVNGFELFFYLAENGCFKCVSDIEVAYAEKGRIFL